MKFLKMLIGVALDKQGEEERSLARRLVGILHQEGRLNGDDLAKVRYLHQTTEPYCPQGIQTSTRPRPAMESLKGV